MRVVAVRSSQFAVRRPRADDADEKAPEPIVPTVDHEHRPLLYLPNGRVLVVRAGF